ncbi:uncharacterized protein VP01_2257g3 [Puccinia sorghi]|uniref:Uncharacterized protein n=1 Tax=Puccinia sorghi TaxID=27349 RepID=A0A0L6V8J6_9BASI|nr:uncharacterized protein VP01_2257g3 [Puccinia sorghi]
MWSAVRYQICLLKMIEKKQQINPASTQSATNSNTQQKHSWIWTHFEVSNNPNYAVCQVHQKNWKICRSHLKKDRTGTCWSLQHWHVPEDLRISQMTISHRQILKECHCLIPHQM